MDALLVRLREGIVTAKRPCGLPEVVILGSGSPRRLHLLSLLGLRCIVAKPQVDESPLPHESVHDYVLRLAHAKSGAVSLTGAPVITADTAIDLDGTILGKPVDQFDATRMLKSLSGRSHRVRTGVVVRDGSKVVGEVVTTEVRFRDLSNEWVQWYVATGEGSDKAGGYGIQGIGECLIEAIAGSVSNVIGLPLSTVTHLLEDVSRGPEAES